MRNAVQVLAVLAPVNVVMLAHGQAADPVDAGGVELQLGGGASIALRRYQAGEIAIDIDGVIAEQAWSGVTPFNGMRIIDPDTLEPAPCRTDARIFYTSRGPYMSLDMVQPVASLIRRITVRVTIEINRDTAGRSRPSQTRSSSTPRVTTDGSRSVIAMSCFKTPGITRSATVSS